MAQFVVKKEEDRFNGLSKSWMNHPLFIKSGMQLHFYFSFFDVYDPKEGDHLLKLNVEAMSTSGSTSLGGGEIEIMIDGDRDNKIIIESGLRNHQSRMTTLHGRYQGVVTDSGATITKDYSQDHTIVNNLDIEDNEYYMDVEDLKRICEAHIVSIRIYEGNGDYYELKDERCAVLIKYSQIFYREVYDQGMYRGVELSQMTFWGKVIWGVVGVFAAIGLIVLIAMAAGGAFSNSSSTSDYDYYEGESYEAYETGEVAESVEEAPVAYSYSSSDLEGYYWGSFGDVMANMIFHSDGTGTIEYEIDGLAEKRDIMVTSVDSKTNTFVVEEMSPYGFFVHRFEGCYTGSSYYGEVSDDYGNSVPFAFYLGD